MPTAAFWEEPEKITSSRRRARRVRDCCSPSTQRIDSATLLLPEPLGPITAVTPGANSNSVFVAKLLNPCNFRRLRYMARRCLPTPLLRRANRGLLARDGQPRARLPACCVLFRCPGLLLAPALRQ